MRLKELLGSRSAKYGSNLAASITIVLGIVVLVNFLANRHNYRFDTTKSKIYSLADQTNKLLKGLDKDVKVTAFFREGRGQRLKDLLEEYRYRSGRISYEFVDPDRNPGKARRYGIKEYGTVVVESGTREEKVTNPTEKDLTSAILKVTRKEKKIVYFLEGHGEKAIDEKGRDGYSVAKEELEANNYQVKDLVLARETQVPEDCAVLIAAGPREEYLVNELSMIRDYLKKGGKAFFLLDPGYYSGLEGLAAEWSIVVGDDFIVDASGIGSLFGVDYSMPIISQYGDHPITQDLRIMSFYPLARSVSLSKGKKGNITGTELAKTTPRSWAETDLTPLKRAGQLPKFDPQRDKRGPVSVAVAVSGSPEGSESGSKGARLVIFGDSEFANNQFFKQQANGDLFLNSINWLAEEEELVSIRPKEPGFSPLYLTRRQGKTIFWLTLVLLPAAVLVSGVVIWWKKRR
ncbi:MAG TPA: hypothetical protein EYP53_04850 [Candidatus Latescibacteria bacterium]|nr:hypothetical protein [Candidatus Latescibacterota bacterium]